jgi:hypothetical protein
MSHSLISADRSTHVRIITVALAAGVSVVMLAGAGARTRTDAQPAHAHTAGPVLKAGKSMMSATASLVLIR